MALSRAATEAAVDERPKHASAPPSIVRATVRALAVPRRLVPVLVVCVALVGAQLRFSQDALAAPLGLLLCLVAVPAAAVSYRVLFPDGLEFSHGAVRVVLYATIGIGVVLTVGAVVPKVLDMGPTLLTARPALVVAAALFLVGGWGLGRDIDVEASLAREKRRAATLEREAEMAQLLALRAHLDPHFLFNTLNAIAEWCRADGETAERAVLELSALLRAVLDGVRTSSWTLAKELTLVRSLLDLHLLRDPERFTLSVEAPAPLVEVRIPPMLLLPLAENAVKHGPMAGHRGRIELRVAPDGDGVVVVRLSNPGPYGGPRAGSSGLPTVARRLALAYDGHAALHIEPDGDARTIVEVRIPRGGPAAGSYT